MKKRRTLIISLLLVVALSIGVGYAGFAINLYVNGTATLRGEAPNVVFSHADIDTEETTDAIEPRAGLGSTGGASFDIDAAGFENVGDKLVVVLEVTNGHNFEVNVSDVTTNVEALAGVKYFEATAEWDNTQRTIAAHGTKYVTVTIELIKDTSDELTQNFTVTFQASQGTPTAAAGA